MSEMVWTIIVGGISLVFGVMLNVIVKPRRSG